MTAEQVEQTGPVELDGLATYLDAYTQAKAEAERWTDIANQARRVIEQALGEAQTGTVAGQPRVRWTTVTSIRLDTKAVKDKAPDVYAACQVTGTARRFTLVDGSR